ncbi:hypothetical protein HPB47_010015 [Ixodes persulcatus]|uniref:Uncharacterized protein n=1 Tax=Ixodes persulcatus TaxID=34615 RepID=A0AC60P0C2_IXOPE|nr:hypothetical protein HPB47_010015 [Ixodes persulcatus]
MFSADFRSGAPSNAAHAPWPVSGKEREEREEERQPSIRTASAGGKRPTLRTQPPNVRTKKEADAGAHARIPFHPESRGKGAPSPPTGCGRRRRAGARRGNAVGASEILQCRYATVQDHPSAGAVPEALRQTTRRTLKGQLPLASEPPPESAS